LIHIFVGVKALNSLKKEFLELLDKDLEFRYAVAGYLGLGEILKKLDAIVEEQKNLREEQVRLREDFGKLVEEQVRLREDFNRMLLRIEGLEKTVGRMDVRLVRVERTLEKLTVDVEDEAKSVVKRKLEEVGVSLELTSLILPDLELNLYGVSDDVCVVGEATVRAGGRLVDELLEKLGKLKINYPDRLRKKIILVLYVSLPMVDLVEKAKEKNIWLFKATEEFYRPKKLFIKI